MRIWPARSLAAFVVAASILAGCGGGSYTAATTPRPPASGPAATATPSIPVGSSSIPGTVPLSGSVRFPSSVALDLKALTVQNSLGAAPLDAGGAFTVRAFGDAQLALVAGSAGKPLLLSFLRTKGATLSVHTTAEVLVFYGAYFFMLPSAQRQIVLESLDTLPGLTAIENALTSAIVAHPTASSITDPGVVTAVHGLIGALVASNAMQLPAVAALSPKKFGRESLTISPVADGRSGITPILDSLPDGLHFQNRYRRSASAFVDQVSHVAQDDPGVPGTQINDGPPDRSPAQSIGSVSGFNGVLGTINDIVAAYFANSGQSNGSSSVPATAYTPVNTDTLPLANIAGAKSSRYRVAVVGPGLGGGDESQLTVLEKQAQLDTSTAFMITEVLVPFAASVALGANALNAHGATGDLIKELLPLYAAIPNFQTAAAAGDVKTIFTLGLTSLASAGIVQDKTFDAILRYVGSAATGNAAAATASLAFSRVLTGGDLLLGALDAAAVATDLVRSNRADVYFVDAVATKLTLTPSSATIAPLATVNLTAKAQDAETANATLVYSYTNTAMNGHLGDGIAGHRDNFESTMAKVTYVADAVGSNTNDTVTVTAKIVNGQTRTPVGMASSTITVQSASPSPSPNRQAYTGGFSGTYSDPGARIASDRIVLYGQRNDRLLHYDFYIYNAGYKGQASVVNCVPTDALGGGGVVACPANTNGQGDATLDYSPDYNVIHGTLHYVGGVVGSFTAYRDDRVDPF